MPTSFLSIDSTSATPPFEQLRVQVTDAVRAGTLMPGAKLPTVRALAGQLGLANNTVARAYRELEHDEVLETRGRLGTFVAATGDGPHRQAQLAAIVFADRVRRLGIDPLEALSLVTAALNR